MLWGSIGFVVPIVGNTLRQPESRNHISGLPVFTVMSQ